MDGIFAPWHIVIVLVIALLVFGPKRLPQMGHSLGKSITSFRQGLQEAKEEFSSVTREASEVSEPNKTNVTVSPPLSAPTAAATARPAAAEPAANAMDGPVEPSARV